MARTMKAAVVREFGSPLSIQEAPIPQPGSGEVLIQVVACGIYHTELHAAERDWPVKPALPFIPGVCLEAPTPSRRSGGTVRLE